MAFTNTIKSLFLTLLLGVISLNSLGQCGSIELVSDNYSLCQPAQFKWVLKNTPPGSKVTWDFGYGKQLGNDTFYAFIDKAGSVSLDLKITQPGGNICYLSKPDFVNVNPIPLPEISVSKKILCNGVDSVTYFDLTPNSVKRTWVIDGSYFYNTQPKFTYTYKTEGVKKISLVVENSYGCIGIKNFDSINIIYTKPTLDISADITTGCISKSVTFESKINTYGISIDSYIWSFPGGQPFMQLSKSPTVVNYSTSGVFSPSLEIKTANGCSYKVTKQNYQYYGTPVNLSLKISDTSICLGNKVTIENLDKTLTGNFNWTIAGASRIDQPDKYTNFAFYNTLGKFDITVNYNDNGCSASQTLSQAIRTKDVTAAFTSTDYYHCKLPHGVHFTNLSKSYEPGTTFYNWRVYENSTLIHSSNLVNDSFKVNNSGLFDVVLIASHTNGCSDTIKKQQFISNKKIAPDFDALYTYGCVNQNIVFVQKTPVSSYQAVNKYKWTFYNKNSSTVMGYSTDDNPVFSYSDTGFYKVKMVADNGVGCKDSITRMSFIEIVKPKIDFDLTESVFCKNDLLNAKGSSTPAHINFRYFWYLKNKVDGTEIFKESPTFNEALNKSGQYDFKFVHQINTGCRDSIVNNKLLNSNGISGIISLDSSNGCLPFYVMPSITITENYHFGSLSNSTKIKWNCTPNMGVTVLKDTTNNPEFIFTKKGSYQIEAEVTNSVGCSQIIFSKTVNAGVAAQFSVSDSIVCSKQTIQLNDISSLGHTDRKWIINSNTTTGDPLNSVLLNAWFTNNGTQKIGLIVNKYNACYDTIYKTVRSKIVKANFEGLQTVMKCAPVYAKFVSRSINADSFQWNFGNGTQIITTDSLVGNIYNKNTTSDNGYTITLIAKSIEGCSDTLAKPNYLKIIGPVPEFSLSNFIGCSPLEVQFKNNSKDVYKSYISYGDNSADDSVVTKHSFKTVNPDIELEIYLPKLYSVDILGCVAVFESTDTIKVFANPKAAFNLSDSNLCAKKTIKLTNNSINFSISNFYLFDSIIKKSIFTDTFSILKKGTYNLIQIVKNANNCYDTLSKDINVNPNPFAGFTLLDTLCLSKPVTFKNQSTSQNSIVKNEWIVMNPIIPTFYNTLDCKYSFNTFGNASVKLKIADINNCQDSIIKYLVVSNPDSIPTGKLKMVSVNFDNTVSIESDTSNYYRYLLTNFYFKNSLINSTPSKSGLSFSYALPSNIDSVCIDLTITDVCGYESAKSLKHCTVFLTVSSNKSFTNQLNWSPYVGFPKVTSYLVYRRKQTEPTFELIKTLPGNTISWLDSGLCNTEYWYYISASYNTLNSQSNIAKNTPQFIYPVSYSDIKNVSVINTNTVEIKWEQSANQIFDYYSLFKTNIQSGKTDIIKLSAPVYYDKSVFTSNYNYLYKVAETDKCNNSSQVNLEGKTILLNGTVSNYNSLLNWNTYKNWLSGIKSYTVEIEKDGKFSAIGTFNNSDSFYIHKQQLENIHGPYCYRVYAVSGDNKDTSYSNIYCLISPSTLYFPNAFSPNEDGINEKIGAKSLFVYNNTPILGRNFSLEIFNRSGEKIFNSINIDDEWDGIYKGKPVQSGVYMYHLKAMGADYRSYSVSGTITIL